MPFCECGDISIYYETEGSGPPLLLISGLGGGSWSWYGQVPFFKQFYFTIVFDNRGAGRSSMPPGPYSMEQLAKDALNLLDHLQIEKAFVLGLSMGGMIAQELTLMAQDRLRALVLGCTHCGGKKKIPPSTAVLEIFMNNDGLSPEEIIDKNIPFFFSPNCLENRQEIVDEYRRVQLAVPLQPDHAFRAQLAAIQSFDCCDRLAIIHVPTLILTGTEDQLVPSQNATILAERIPNAELIVLQGAGHAIHAECREELNRLSRDFFNRHLRDDVSSENRGP